MQVGVTVVIVDHHAMFREALRTAIKDFVGITIVGEAAEGQTGIKIIASVKPSIVLLEIDLPGLNGIELIARMRTEYPVVRSVILSGYSDSDHVLKGLRAGAWGYVPKTSSIHDLEAALRSAARGEKYLSPQVSDGIINKLLTHEENDQAQVLTFRQREVLQLIAEGHTAKEIASILDVSYRTVETHRRDIMERLNIKNVAGLARYAERVGLVGCKSFERAV